MSAHTPGPLHVAPCPAHEEGYRCTAIRTADGQKLEPTTADLHLWAAAPEMLEALRICRQFIQGAEVRNWPPGFELRQRAMSLSRAAITKALGEKP
jgi:hypothetical protein